VLTDQKSAFHKPLPCKCAFACAHKLVTPVTKTLALINDIRSVPYRLEGQAEFPYLAHRDDTMPIWSLLNPVCYTASIATLQLEGDTVLLDY